MNAIPPARERPIIFNAPMVRAILDGRKTQSRRLVKPQPASYPAMRPEPRTGRAWVFMAHSDKPSYQFATGDVQSPYGTTGDRLWVREAWRGLNRFNGAPVPVGSLMAFEADENCGDYLPCQAASSGRTAGRMGVLRSPLLMPRWASRITLELTAVRVERLQSITPADCMAEGVGHLYGYDDSRGLPADARERFAELWNELHAKKGHGWATNPWLWVLTFKRVEP